MQKSHLKSTYFISLVLISCIIYLSSCGSTTKKEENATAENVKPELSWRDIRRAGTADGGRFFEDNLGNKLFNGAVFYNAFEFSGGYCVVIKLINGKKLNGVINSKGEMVIDCKTEDHIHSYDHGFFEVSKEKTGYMDSTGKMVMPMVYRQSRGIENGLIRIELDGKWGVINLKNETIVPFKYDKIGYWANDIALVSIRKNYKDFYGYINKKGEQLIDCQYDDALDFEHGIALVKKGKKIGFINQKNEYSQTGTSNENSRFVMEEGYIVLSKDKKWGYIDTTGKEIIPFKYDYLGLPSKNRDVIATIGNKSETIHLKKM